MNTPTLTRRAAIIGAAASSVAVVAPVAMARESAAPMDLQERMAHHFQGLADALAEWGTMAKGEWQITINSLHPYYAIDNVTAMRAREAAATAKSTPAIRRDHHLQRFMEEAAAADPTIAAWHQLPLPDHWSGVRFQLIGVNHEALAEASHDRIGFLHPISEFVGLDGKAVM